MQKINCLLIDDDKDERLFFEMALEEVPSAIELIYEMQPIAAIEKLKAGEMVPHYIFLDINMPKMNGWECLLQIDKLQHLNHVPIVMYSTSLASGIPVEIQNRERISLIKKMPKISELIKFLQEYFPR